jgi:hypothetical protein
MGRIVAFGLFQPSYMPLLLFHFDLVRELTNGEAISTDDEALGSGGIKTGAVVNAS